MENLLFGMLIQKGAEKLEVGDAAIGTDTKEFPKEHPNGCQDRCLWGLGVRSLGYVFRSLGFKSLGLGVSMSLDL